MCFCVCIYGRTLFIGNACQYACNVSTMYVFTYLCFLLVCKFLDTDIFPCKLCSTQRTLPVIILNVICTAGGKVKIGKSWITDFWI